MGEAGAGPLAVNSGMRTDEALDAILAIESTWRRKRGRVTLADLGLRRTVRSRGHAGLPPEQWRRYPGAVAARHEWTLEV